MKIHKIGVVGVGVWGCHSLERELLATGRCRIKRVFAADFLGANNGTDPQMYAESLGAELADSLNDIVHDEEIDIVSVMTAPRQKADILLSVLKHNKSFITDKPLAFSASEAQRILAAEKKSRGIGFVLVGYHTRPAVSRLLELLKSGSLGQVKSINLRLNFTGGIYPGFHPDEAWARDIAGGESVTIGSHALMTVKKLANSDFERITCVKKNDFYDSYARVNRDDYAIFNFRFINGVTGNLSVGRLPYRILNEDLILELTATTHYAEIRNTTLTIYPGEKTYHCAFSGGDILKNTCSRFLDAIENPDIKVPVTCREAADILI